MEINNRGFVMSVLDYKLFFDLSPLPIFIIQDRVLQLVNQKMARLAGYTVAEMVNLPVTDLIHPEDLPLMEKNTLNFLAGKEDADNCEFRSVNRSGEIKYIRCLYSRIQFKGRPAILGQAVDITDRILAEEQLKYLSLHDPLTGLYNRAYFEEEIIRLERGRLSPVSLILCDVDGLKLVNDTLGHDAGDQILNVVAGILKECFRSGDMVARVGGDEFAILLPGSDRLVVGSACRRILESVDSYNEDGPGFPLSLSVGVATGEGKESNISSLFKEADNNMHREKLHRRQSARSSIVQTLMKALEARDFITEGHADRLQQLVAGVAVKLGLPDHSITDLRLLAQFHDIGKVGIPDRILFKPGPLTCDEYMEMKRHSEIGYRIAKSAPDLAPIAEGILKHHEWWNGEGYPLGLKGEEIPLECRILSIADAYDAMTSDRPYRRAMSHKLAVEELKRGSGTQLDPRLVPLFVDLVEKTGH